MNESKNIQNSIEQAVNYTACCAPVLSLDEAKNEAINNGKKIRHRYFLDNEFLEYKDGKWITEEGYEVSFHYWIGMVKEMFTDWCVVS